MATSPTLRDLRSKRTRASNVVRADIDHLLTSEIKWRLDGHPAVLPQDRYSLPSWWPFWSDVLVKNVRELVRLARALNAAEQKGLA